MHYILNEFGEPVIESDFLKWAEWFESSDRKLARDEIGSVLVSTVFLGMDHGFGGTPVLWETMVFGGVWDGWERRYTIKKAALDGHAFILALVEGLSFKHWLSFFFFGNPLSSYPPLTQRLRKRLSYYAASIQKAFGMSPPWYRLEKRRIDRFKQPIPHISLGRFGKFLSKYVRLVRERKRRDGE